MSGPAKRAFAKRFFCITRHMRARIHGNRRRANHWTKQANKWMDRAIQQMTYQEQLSLAA